MNKHHLNATHYEEIPAFSKASWKAERCVNAVIETPKGSTHKYALNNDLGIIAFHEVLPGSLRWPYDYGFIPQTLGDDGDPLDILVLTEGGLFSGCLIEARFIGTVYEKKDDVVNSRLIAVPRPSPGAPLPTDQYRDIADIPQAALSEITAFLKIYSELQGHRIDDQSLLSADETVDVIKQGMKAFKKRHG